MTLQNESDEELLGLMLAGDEAAFTMLYRRRQPAVYRFALQMSGSRSIAEDVTQEVFLVLMRDGRNFDPGRASLTAFLYGIARNHVLRCLDRDRRCEAVAGRSENDEAAAHAELATTESALAGLLRDERVEAVRGAVLALPAHYREVVVLCDLHEMDYAQAAGALRCPVGTVRSRLHRAHGLLAERLRGGVRSAECGVRNASSLRCALQSAIRNPQSEKD